MEKKVFVVFKTHFDIGFTELAEKVIEKYGRVMLKDVIKTCKDTQTLGEDKKYVWTMSTWPLVQSLKEENADAADIAAAKQLIREGQITWHGLPFTTHTEFCGLEELIYGLSIGNQLGDTYGFQTIAAKMTDVPGHTWILPTLLAGNGIEFLHLGCNPSAVPPNVPRLFWWEGPDGSRVLTFYSKGSYGSSLTPPEDWPYPVWLALMQTNDNIGPQDPQVIQALEKELQEKDSSARMIVGRLDDFYRELIKYPLDIPVIKKDLADTWIHGVGTYPAEVSRLRNNRRKIRQLEMLNLMTQQKDLTDDINRVYEDSLLFGEHTWGLDVKTHMGWNRAYEKRWFLKHKDSDICQKMEKSWNEQRQRVERACELTDVLYRELMQEACGEKHGYTVYNTNGVEGEQWVTIDTHAGSLIDARSGEILCQRTSGQAREFLIPDMPGVGTVRVLENSAPGQRETDLVVTREAEHVILENTYYRISVDTAGGVIESIKDKRNGKEWVDQTLGEAFFDYRYDVYATEEIQEFIRSYTYRFYDWWINDIGRMGYPEQKHQVYRPRFQHVEIKESQGQVVLVFHKQNPAESFEAYGNSEELQLSVILKAYSDVIGCQISLPQKRETPFVEAGHVIFPLRIDGADFILNKTGSRVNAGTDICEGANHAMYCIDDYVDVTNGNDAMCIVSHDIPLLSIGEQKIYRFQPQPKIEKPILYFNCFNNWWGTNFPQWIGGNLTFAFSMFSHRSQEPVEGKVSRILNRPVALRAEKVEDGIGDIYFGNTFAVLRMMKNLDGSYTVRLRNILDRAVEEKIIIQNVRSACQCTLNRQIVREYEVDGDSFLVCANPYEIVTIQFYVKR